LNLKQKTEIQQDLLRKKLIETEYSKTYKRSSYRNRKSEESPWNRETEEANRSVQKEEVSLNRKKKCF
jgi:hypothetical protein